MLELGLPDGDGFGVLDALRESPGGEWVGVIFLSPSRESRDEVVTFALGAEDYVERPFERAGLRSCAKARLAPRAPRSPPSATPSTPESVRPISLKGMVR